MLARSSVLAASFVVSLLPLQAKASQLELCMELGKIAGSIMELRQAGFSQNFTAKFMGENLGEILSNKPGAIKDRQYLADMLADRMTYIIQFAYTMPYAPQYADDWPKRFTVTMLEKCVTERW